MLRNRSTAMRIISFRQMKELNLCLWSRAHVDREEKAGRFPERVEYGNSRVGWVQEEVEEHNRKLAAKRSRPTSSK
jgi:predicted DNA-binding transcriptional regulator AlpA